MTKFLLHKLGSFIDSLMDRQVEDIVANTNKHMESSSEVHGVTGEVVGTIDAQTISNKKFGGDTDYSEFEANGTLHMVGNATVWNDINISVVPQTGGATVPSVIAFNGDSILKCIAFSGTNPTPDELPSSLEVLHDYKEGTDIHVHIHWLPTDTTVANIKWQLRYSWTNRGETAAAGVTVTSTETTSGTAWHEQTTSFVISGTGKTMGSRFVFSLFRDPSDAADTYAHNAAVTDIGLHYERDTTGSRQILEK